MFENYIRETKRLNRLDLNAVKGKRMYYNKTRNILSLGVVASFYLAFTVLLISLSNSKEPMWLVFGCLFALILVLYILRVFSMLLLRNPLYILQGDQIYYLKTNQWYNIMEHDFRDEMLGKFNYYETFCMFDRNGKQIWAEKNWYLKDEEVFKSHLKYNKLILSRNKPNDPKSRT
jgi:hypothetical protein